MNQIRDIWNALTRRQQITIGAAGVLIVASLFALTHWRNESDFKALYTSLSQEDAAAVVQRLKEAGTEYRVSENGTAISAPSARVAELRLDLAAAGIPKSGRIGYELFDKTNFGATEFTEHLNYHRALEGELERSVAALSSVEAARVHLTFPKESVFLDSRQPGKASVLLKLRLGSRLTAPNVSAIANLVASSVEGLNPDSVSILDMRGNLLNRPHHSLDGDEQTSEATLEYRQKVEVDLLNKINATLEPLLGAEKFRAGVSVECDFNSGEQSEETVDPTKSVMLTSQKTEEQTGSNSASGQPGTASTLPRPTSRPGSGTGGLSRRTENITFQSNRVVRHTKLSQGSIKKMSISVLVDHIVSFQGKGPKSRRVVSPPAPETLKAIHDLVAAATGLSAERGDQLVIEALPFEATLNAEPLVEQPATPPDPRIPRMFLPLTNQFSTLLIGGAVLVVALALLLATLLLARKRKTNPVAMPAITPPAGSSRPLPGESLAEQRAEQASLESDNPQKRESELLENLRVPIATTKKADVLLKHLRDNSAKDVVSTANVLRAWMSESEQQIK